MLIFKIRGSDGVPLKFARIKSTLGSKVTGTAGNVAVLASGGGYILHIRLEEAGPTYNHDFLKLDSDLVITKQQT